MLSQIHSPMPLSSRYHATRTAAGLVALTFILIAVSACMERPSNQGGQTTPVSSASALVPEDTTDLWLGHGPVDSDTVLVHCQGGPSDSLGFERHGRTSLRYLPGYDRFRVAYVHQAQTLNPTVYAPRSDFTLEEAAKAVDATSEMLHRSIRYHKDRGKTVFVLGASYGAFVIQHYLANHPPEADGYVIMAGRLDMDQPMVTETREGWAGEFAEDGRTYIPADRSEADTASVKENWTRLVKNRLKAAIGLRYTAALSDVDLSNVRYFYATNDQAVGALTEAEIDFLEERGATVFKTSDGHGEVLYRFIDSVMEGRLRL